MDGRAGRGGGADGDVSLASDRLLSGLLAVLPLHVGLLDRLEVLSTVVAAPRQAAVHAVLTVVISVNFIYSHIARQSKPVKRERERKCRGLPS